MSYSLLGSGIASVAAITLFIIGTSKGSSETIWAGLCLFATATVIWLTLFGFLTAKILRDAGILALHGIRKRQAARNEPADQPPEEYNRPNNSQTKD